MNLAWFTGMVEDISDPNEMGRVRVRCFGFHTPKTVGGVKPDLDEDGKPDLDTPDLLWAPCILPVTDPNINGVAGTPPGLQPGSMVIGFFRDSPDFQDPVILGGISNAKGYDTKYQENLGFGDPNGMFTYSSFHDDFPEDSKTFGSVNGQSERFSKSAAGHCGSASIGAGQQSSSFDTDGVKKASIVLAGDGSIEDFIKIALAESRLGVVEDDTLGRDNRSKNPADIGKYWQAVPSHVGSNGRGNHWCAAFVCWCVREWGIFEDKDRPKSAGVKELIRMSKCWADRNPAVSRYSGTGAIAANGGVQPGDLVSFGWGSHIGIAVEKHSNPKRIWTVEGNTGDPSGGLEGCWKKQRWIHNINHIARFNLTQKPNAKQPSVVPIPGRQNIPIPPANPNPSYREGLPGREPAVYNRGGSTSRGDPPS